jgi:uncharacterized protein YggE
MRIFFLFLFLLMLVIGNAFAKEHSNGQNGRIIEVSGVSNVISVPDRFSFSVSIEQKGSVASELNRAIVDKTNIVIQALIKIGVEKKQFNHYKYNLILGLNTRGMFENKKGLF